MTTVWHRALLSAPCPVADRMLAELQRAGIVVSGQLPEEANVRLLVTDNLGGSLFAEAEHLSDRGNARLLVVLADTVGADLAPLWTVVGCGVADVLRLGDPCETARSILARIERWNEVDRILQTPLVHKNLIGDSPAWQRVLRQVIELAAFTKENVLILGDTGTGKELIARLIHTLDRRRAKRDLVVLDCTTIVPDLSGSEFFGHERGAYTGALAERRGAFALADGGSLFLDEVGDLPPAMQAELLRVVQEGTFKPVGGNRWQQSKFRLICATNRDLAAATSNGLFRSDLFYRLAGCTVKLPPLAERLSDIIPLARHFLATAEADESPLHFDPVVEQFLICRCYPGNVRELQQLVTRLRVRHVGGGTVTVGDLPEDERPVDAHPPDWRGPAFEGAVRLALSQGRSLKQIGDAAEELAEQIAVEQGGSMKSAALRLGLTDRALQMRRARRRPRLTASD